jgi:hypothetical protein
MPLVASLVDTLLVFDELSGDGPVATRPLFSMQSGKPAMTFGDWLGSPSKRPRCIVLPGFQSAMAGGLTKLPARPGEDIFLAVTDLVAAGGRTALVSRWRMGGRSFSGIARAATVRLSRRQRRRVGSGPSRWPPPNSQTWGESLG